jgi:protein associated with RNAse G/E
MGQFAAERLNPGTKVHVEKRDFCGDLRLSYEGTVLQCTRSHHTLLTHWTETADYGLFRMNRGDPVHEHFYPGRWYNVLQLMDRNLEVKGWYCDICLPPNLRTDPEKGPFLQYTDLALDVFVHPDGSGTVLDIGEFHATVRPHLSETQREKCGAATREILMRARLQLPPFAAERHGATGRD